MCVRPHIEENKIHDCIYIKDGLKEKGHFFLLSNFFSLLLILKEEHVSDKKNGIKNIC